MMEKSFIGTDGFQLAAQHYPAASTHTRKILMLHGWLDNSRSFWKLAPALAEANHEVVALDFPGHGLSGHRPPEAPSIVLAEGVYAVAEVLQQLDWTSEVTLVGHSMGAAIALMYAATFPDQMERLVLLEGAGPLEKPDEDLTKHMKAHVEKRLKGNRALYGENAKGPKVHASLEAAIETRMQTAQLSPGNQYLSRQAASEMVSRATRSVEGGVEFLHDYRLTWPSLMYMTPSQVQALQSSVQCPTCLLLAKDGWPFDEERLEGTKGRLKPQQFAKLPGSHHFHADPDSAQAVAEHVLQFLE